MNAKRGGEQVRAMLKAYRVDQKSKAEMLAAAGMVPVYLNYRRHLHPLLQAGIIERTIPDKPTSRL